MKSLLLENFEALADAPNAVPKLRELVLQLAFRGVLVPQVETEEPVSRLLQRASAEAARLGAEGKIKRRKSPLPLDYSSVPHRLPVGWQWARLGEIGLVGSSARVHQRDWQTSGIPFYRAREIVELSKRGSVANELFISREQYESLVANGLSPAAGDVMLTGVGTIGVPYVVTSRDLFYFKDASVLIFKNLCGIDPYFLFWFFKSEQWRRSIHANSMGTTVDTLTIERADVALIPLAPVSEQKRIVAKVDELMGRCDELEAKQEAKRSKLFAVNRASLRALTEPHAASLAPAWRRIRHHFDHLYATPETVVELRQTILQLAVIGRLVPQDPNDKPASELLKEIHAERRRRIAEGSIRKGEGLPGAGSQDIWYEIPRSWVWTRFGDVTFNRDGERVPVSREEREHRQGPYPYYGASGIIDSIDEYLFDKPLLLVGEDGANLVNRSTPIAFIAAGQYWVNNHAHVLDSLDLDMLRYLELFVNATDLTLYITGTAQPKMNQAKMNRIPVALPPAGEQKRIVARVDQLMAQCDELESRLQRTEATAEALLASVVRELVTAERGAAR